MTLSQHNHRLLVIVQRRPMTKDQICKLKRLRLRSTLRQTKSPLSQKASVSSTIRKKKSSKPRAWLSNCWMLWLLGGIRNLRRSLISTPLKLNRRDHSFLLEWKWHLAICSAEWMICLAGKMKTTQHRRCSLLPLSNVTTPRQVVALDWVRTALVWQVATAQSYTNLHRLSTASVPIDTSTTSHGF